MPFWPTTARICFLTSCSRLVASGRGRPSVPADVVATVMVLQALEGLSDREAAAQLRQSIAWKVTCGLSLVIQASPTVLTLWRSRLRASARPERVYEAVRAVIAQTGVLAGRQRRALDSTLLDDAVATQDGSPSCGGGPPGASAMPADAALSWVATTTTMIRASRSCAGMIPVLVMGW